MPVSVFAHAVVPLGAWSAPEHSADRNDADWRSEHVSEWDGRMSVLVALLTLVLLAAVMAVVSRPLLFARTRQDTNQPGDPGAAVRSELEAEREAKYREIRDAELDYRTGKLSQEDYDAVNGALRAEALEILNKLDETPEEERDGSSGRDRMEGSSGPDRMEGSSDQDRTIEEIEEDQTTDPAK